MPASVVWKGREFQEHLLKHIRKGVAAGGVLVQREAKRLVNRKSSRGGESPSAEGTPPHKDTGTLGRSIQIDGRGLKDRRAPSVLVGSNLAYAAVQEFGGVIKAKPGKALTVPIGSKGRKLLRTVGPGGLRSLDLEFIPRQGRPPLLVRLVGGKKSKSIEVLFVLMKSVRLPKRPYMRPARTLAEPKVNKAIQKSANDAARSFKGVR